MSFPRFSLLVCALICAVSVAIAKPKAPDWLAEAAARPTPTYEKKPDAVILKSDTTYEVREDGTILETTRVALRVLNITGADNAFAREDFYGPTEKVKGARAWVVPVSGDVIAYAKSDFVEKTPSSLPNSLISDERVCVLSASSKMRPNDTFGYEFVVERRSIITQRLIGLRGSLPVCEQRIVVELPPGWSVEPFYLNHEENKPVVEGSRTTWLYRDIPALPSEPGMPSPRQSTHLLAINFVPPTVAKTKEKLVPRFADWTAVSVYFTEHEDKVCIVDPAITAKATELTVNAKTPVDVIRAIARHAQEVNYAAIQANLARGGGWIPQPSTLTLQRNYGDCKDKANLLRALLRAKGITAFPVLMYSGDNSAVKEVWPSPSQFNHAIIAIQIPADFESPAVIDHPKLGRLLIFDPTNELVPFGELPVSHHGSQVLIQAGTDGGLVRLPPLPADSNTVTRRVEAVIAADGALTATIQETNTGFSAVFERELYRESNKEDYQKAYARILNGSIRAAKITKLDPEDRFESNQFGIRLEVASFGYAQSLRGKLLIFKPALYGRRESIGFTEPKRTQPILFTPFVFNETAVITLPPGYVIDELPKPAELKTKFASYSSSYSVDKGVLTYQRSYRTNHVMIPAAEYAEVKTFQEKMLKAEQAPVVLARIQSGKPGEPQAVPAAAVPVSPETK